MADRIACPNPRCPFPNDVRPVPTEVESGTVVGTWTTGQSELSRLLAPPTKPAYDEGLDGGGFCSLLAVIGVVLLVAFVIVAFAIGDRAHSAEDNLLIGAYIAVMVVIGIAIGRWNAAKVARSRALFERQLPRWNKAMARWKSAYYCPRCRSVFVPDESGYASADNLQSLLYR